MSLEKISELDQTIKTVCFTCPARVIRSDGQYCDTSQFSDIRLQPHLCSKKIQSICASENPYILLRKKLHR